MKILLNFPDNNLPKKMYSIKGDYLLYEHLDYLTITGPSRMKDVLLRYSDNFTKGERNFLLSLLDSKDISNFKIAFCIIDSKPDVNEEKERNSQINQTRET